MPEVIKDTDLPTLLNTPTKQIKWAKKLVAEHLGSAAKRVDKPPFQGMYSRTHFLTLADGRKVVVQFRNEPLDMTPFQTAKSVLGSYVPDIQALDNEELQSEEAYAYTMNIIPGLPWLRGICGKGAEGRITIAKSLGCVLSRGFIADSSTEAVKSKLRPHLDAILASPLDEITPYKPILEKYAKRLDDFAQLPLWIAHHDLNEVNVLIDSDCKVTGLVDWELSKPLPFGAGFGRIHTIAGEYSQGEFYMPDEFEIAERGFWKELFDGMPKHIRDTLLKQKELIQDLVILATLLDSFYFDDGEVGAGGVSIKALPKFMTYRIPLVRGEDPPYSG